MLRALTPLMFLVGLVASIGFPAGVQAAAPRYFSETGHNVPDFFASYWSANGGLEAFGLPLTEPYQRDGLTIQWFERARFERHLENKDTPFEILLGQLCREIRQP